MGRTPCPKHCSRWRPRRTSTLPCRLIAASERASSAVTMKRWATRCRACAAPMPLPRLHPASSGSGVGTGARTTSLCSTGGRRPTRRRQTRREQQPSGTCLPAIRSQGRKSKAAGVVLLERLPRVWFGSEYDDCTGRGRTFLPRPCCVVPARANKVLLSSKAPRYDKANAIKPLDSPRRR